MNERIKRVRQDLGRDQAEFATLMSVSVRTVQHWEAGSMSPRAASMRKLAVLADKPVSWFYEEETEAVA